MRTFLQSLRKSWVRFKIRMKVNYYYPRNKKFARIKSIVPDSTRIGDHIIIEEDVQISSGLSHIGDHVYIGKGTYFGACRSIGKFSSISFDVKIGLISHPLNFVSTSPAFYSPRRGWAKESLYNEAANGPAVIEADVLISANAIVLAGVTIGTGAVIGAGAVVNRDVPPYAIVAGVPAKVIRYRFSEEIIAQLVASKWWDKGDKILAANIQYANNPVEFLKHISI